MEGLRLFIDFENFRKTQKTPNMTVLYRLEGGKMDFLAYIVV